MRRRALILALPLALTAGAAFGQAKEAGNYVDLAPVPMPIIVNGRLVNYVFVYVRINLATGADTPRWRDKEPYFRDALVRLGHRTPFTWPSDYTRLDEARLKDPHANLFDEATVNLMGYELIQAGDNHAAIQVMKLNVKAYPNSPNTYDSLADAYLAAGQKDLARQASNKALELLPSDITDPQPRRDAIKASAEGRLKQLEDEYQ